MLLSESCVASDIAKHLKDDFSKVQHESVVRRITRFFTNKLFNPYSFYNKIIYHVISNYKKKHYELIFLADRWFNSVNLMKHIASLNSTFNLRLKRNIKVLIYDKKEGRRIWKFLNEVKHYEWHSSRYDVLLSDDRFEAHIVLSKKHGTNDPWIIVTNGDPKNTIKDYGYRFGGIETVFKAQKSNGLNLECTCNASEAYFTTMYTMTCFAHLFMTILGADYSKNTKVYKNVKIKTHKTDKGKKIRIMSLFNTGLTLFHLAYMSSKYIRIPYKFILYDI